MTSALVVDVRARIREEGRPLTVVERALLLGTVHSVGRNTAGIDDVTRLEQTIAGARRALAADAEAPALRDALRELLAASRALLEHVPTDRTVPPPEPVPSDLPPNPRPYRADLDR